MSAKGHIITETTGAEKNRVTVKETEDVEKGDESTASAQGDIVIKDTNRLFVRAMRGSSDMVRPGSPIRTFQPPTNTTDWVRAGSSHMVGTYRNKTPSLLGSHSTDYTGHSTDCKMLPDVDGLPDVARVYAMARWGRGIVGSEKTTSSTAAMPRSPEQ